jgi:hypothetical protein
MTDQRPATLRAWHCLTARQPTCCSPDAQEWGRNAAELASFSIITETHPRCCTPCYVRYIVVDTQHQVCGSRGEPPAQTLALEVLSRVGTAA